MKKNLSLVMLFCFAALVACGPNAEEKAAAEKARQDSINAAMAKMTEDSAAAQALMEKARQDSINMVMAADSMAKAEAATKKKPAGKPKPTSEQKKVEEAKKVSGGRGH